MNEPWYEESGDLVRELENEEWHIKLLMGRETDDGWEYAVVTWRYKVCHLEFTFKNGKAKEND